MQTVAETPTFSRQADKLFSEDEKRELIDFLVEHPLAGDEIPGTGGVRKLRFAPFGRGKRGDARVDLPTTWTKRCRFTHCSPLCKDRENGHDTG